MKTTKLIQGNGVKSTFSFGFKVSAAEDLDVYWIDTDKIAHNIDLGDGIDENTFSATINDRQDLNPGGTITTWVALPVKCQLVISRNIENTTSVSVCNLALARLGDEASVTAINPPDGSPQAKYCAIFLPIALSAVLDEHNWSFTTKVSALDLAARNDDPRWLYCYVLPEDFNRVISVFGIYSGAQNFTLATNDGTGPRLLTNQADAYIEYAAAITDPNLFTPAFLDALAWKLAANLAGPIIKGDTGAAAEMKLNQAYQASLKLAKESDSQNRRVSPVFRVPSGIAARV